MIEQGMVVDKKQGWWWCEVESSSPVSKSKGKAGRRGQASNNCDSPLARHRRIDIHTKKWLVD